MTPVITHRDLLKTGIPERLRVQLIAEMTGRSTASIRTSIHQGKLVPTREGLLQYLNSPGKSRFRKNFQKWAKTQEKKGRYSLTVTLPHTNITIEA